MLNLYPKLFGHIRILGLQSQRLKRSAAAFKEFTEELDILKTTAVHIGTQDIDDDIESVAAD